MKRTLIVNLTIFSSILFVFLIALVMLSSGITSVFAHFFYLPILLSAYYYPRFWEYATTIVAISYVLPVMWFFPDDSMVLFSAFVRIFMFFLVGWLISRLVIEAGTEKREKERLLEFQNRIIENPQVMVIVADKEGKVVIWNRAAENITGYGKEEIRRNREMWFSLLPDDETREKLQSIIHEINSGSGHVEEVFLPMRTMNGDIRYLLVSLQRLSGSKVHYSGILAIAVDITEKKRLEVENQKALERIEKNISQMYILNDEIRNPLAIILGQAELDLENSREAIIQQVIRINDIISQLDRDSVESTKILDYLRKHYGFF